MSSSLQCNLISMIAKGKNNSKKFNYVALSNNKIYTYGLASHSFSV